MNSSRSSKPAVTTTKIHGKSERVLHPERACPQQREQRQAAGEARVARGGEVILRALVGRRDVNP